MKGFKFSWRRGIFIAIIVSMLSVFILNVGTVRALFTGAYSLYTVWRFEREVLRTTRTGQYYEGLIFKHAPEMVDLLSKDLNNDKKFMALGETTIPLLEAYLNGDGDSAVITAESVTALKEILDEASVAGSPSLQRDIQTEYEHFPLDNFVGMNMNDAYDHVISSFVVALDDPALVDGTDGKWAYYIYNGVYFEYPSNWYVQVIEVNKENKGGLIIIPSSENPKEWDGEWIIMEIDTNVPSDVAFTGEFSFGSKSGLQWEQSIQTDDMRGVEYAISEPRNFAALVAAELYSAEKLMFVKAGVILLDPFGLQFDRSPEVIKERYEYLFHLVDSVKIIQP